MYREQENKQDSRPLVHEILPLPETPVKVVRIDQSTWDTPGDRDTGVWSQGQHLSSDRRDREPVKDLLPLVWTRQRHKARETVSMVMDYSRVICLVMHVDPDTDPHRRCTSDHDRHGRGVYVLRVTKGSTILPRLRGSTKTLGTPSHLRR